MSDPKERARAMQTEIWRNGATADVKIGPLGFEPRLTDSESVVLPLH